MANWSRTSQGCGDEGSQMYHHELVPMTMWWPQGMLEDIVVSVSVIGWKDSVFRDGHTLRILDIYLDIFSHNFTLRPIMNLSCLHALNLPIFFGTSTFDSDFSIKSLEMHRISHEILHSSGSPSFTASLCGQRGLGFPGHGGAGWVGWALREQTGSDPSFCLGLRPKEPRDWRR